MTQSADTLVLGWGNPGRGDDGLGPQFVQAIAELDLPRVVTDSDYQLQVEDAAQVARFRRVVFVDADRAGARPYWLERLQPAADGLAFSTHSVAPAAVLALARDLFQAEPEAWILGIRGYEFDRFEEQLSERARENLDCALRTVGMQLRSGRLDTPAAGANHPVLGPEREDRKCLTTNP